MTSITQKKEWYSSKEIKKVLHLTSCELMHMRQRNELAFQKNGNAFFYKLPEQFSKSNDHQ